MKKAVTFTASPQKQTTDYLSNKLSQPINKSPFVYCLKVNSYTA